MWIPKGFQWQNVVIIVAAEQIYCVASFSIVTTTSSRAVKLPVASGVLIQTMQSDAAPVKLN